MPLVVGVLLVIGGSVLFGCLTGLRRLGDRVATLERGGGGTNISTSAVVVKRLGTRVDRLTNTLASNYGQLGTMQQELGLRIDKLESGGGSSGGVDDENVTQLSNRVRRVENTLMDVGDTTRANKEQLDRIEQQLASVDRVTVGVNDDLRRTNDTVERTGRTVNDLDTRTGGLTAKTVDLEQRLSVVRDNFDKLLPRIDDSASLRIAFIRNDQFFGMTVADPDVQTFVGRLVVKSLFRHFDVVVCDRVRVAAASSGRVLVDGYSALMLDSSNNASIAAMVIALSRELTDRWDSVSQWSVDPKPETVDGSQSIRLLIEPLQLDLRVWRPTTADDDLYGKPDALMQQLDKHEGALLFVLQTFGHQQRAQLTDQLKSIAAQPAASADNDPFGLFWRDRQRVCTIYRADQLDSLLSSAPASVSHLLYATVYHAPVQFRPYTRP